MVKSNGKNPKHYSIEHRSYSSVSSCIWLTMMLILWHTSIVRTKFINKSAEIATEFIILHNNDMHARFEQTSVDSEKCTPDLAEANKCYGGFARVAHVVREYRTAAAKGGVPVLYLNAGDTYTGTPWFTIFKDNITAAFLNILQPDAISLGNHEFDKNVEGLIPFLNKVNFSVVTCNLDLRKVPELTRTKSLVNSTIFTIHDVKIGVIGYLTPETKNLTTKNDVEFYPEIESINQETSKLKEEGVKIFIALGHSGYHMDQKIARECPDVDIVIGGHSNTFLYNGTQPDIETIEGPYPTIVKQPSGKDVPVVQAYAYTKYLGKLHVQFDKNYKLIKYDGTPILLNATIPRDKDVLDLLELYRPNVTALEKDVIGYTKVHLIGKAEVCRRQECNLGNLVTDSMVYARVLENQGGIYWTDASVALIVGGGIRNSISRRSDGAVYNTDILSVLPFENDLHIINITGKVLRGSLEHSATMFDKDSNGGFLQMSGIKVTYDYNRNEGDRVVKARVRCAECEIPIYEELNDTKWYKVIVPTFVLKGGDGHKLVTSNDTEIIKLQRKDHKALSEYFQRHDFIFSGIEDRIVIIAKETPPIENTTSQENNASHRLHSKSILSAIITFYSLILRNTISY